MNVLVTGGAGYIGSHTAKELARQGFSPIVYDNFSTGHRWACKWGPHVEGDIGDGEKLARAIKNYNVQSIIHFAASAYVGESVKNPRKYFSNNVSGSLSLLNTALDQGVQNFVFSSSCATYGIPNSVPIKESTAQIPINPYGETKLIIEKALKWYSNAFPLRHAALRYFNAAGADKECETGENHDPETHLIPLVLDAALGKRDAIKIFGTDYPTRDGTAERDYVHVEDLARAHILALKKLDTEGESFSCNLGNGVGKTVQEVIDTVASVSERQVPNEEAARRAGDPPSLVADPSLAQELLGWKPQNNFEDIVTDALRWRLKTH